MNNLEKKYKEKINSIDLPNERKDYLKGKLIKEYRKKEKIKNFFLSSLIVFSILLVGTGIAYADDIKNSINKVITKIYNGKSSNGSNFTNYKIESDAIKDLNYDANLRDPKCEKPINDYEGINENDECYSLYSYEELESELGIQLLKNDLFKDNRIILNKVSRIDGKISYIKLRMPNPMKGKMNSNESTDVLVEIAIRTKYNKNNNNNIWETILPSEKNIREYNIESIKCKVYGTASNRFTQNVFILHDDIVYRLRISIGKNALDNPDKEVQRILDAFHY